MLYVLMTILTMRSYVLRTLTKDDNGSPQENAKLNHSYQRR